MNETEEIKEPQPVPEPNISVMLRDNTWNILGVFLCYIIGASVGYRWPHMVSADALAIHLEAINSTPKEFVGKPFEFALNSFGQAAMYLYLVMIFGLFIGVLPVYAMLSAGIFSGAIAANAGHRFWHVLPLDGPGIVEFLATCIALGWGMKLGFSWLQPPRYTRFKMVFIESHRVYFRLALLLLLISSASRFVLGK